MRLTNVALLGLLVFSHTVFAQEVPRPEARIVNHWQKFAENANVGFAAYVNEPDAAHGGLRVFGVVGPAFRDKGKTRWFEVMAGGLTSRTGFDPAIDLRGQIKIKKLDNLVFWGECLHLFKTDRTLLSASITKVVAKRLKLGVESDSWIQQTGNTTGVGPGTGFIINRHMQVWSAYQFGLGKQRDVLRTYLVFNW